MIIGGNGKGSGMSASVLKFDSTNISNDPMKSLLHGRYYHACTTFRSPLHDGRSIIVVAGGYTGGYEYKTTEIWDFTLEGTSWEKISIEEEFITSMLVFILGILRYQLEYLSRPVIPYGSET